MKIRVLKVSVQQEPEVVEIENSLESLQHEVGGYIQALYPFDDPVGIVCDEEGKLKGKEANRALFNEDGTCYDILCGDFLVVGLSEDDFMDLTPELMEKYKTLFASPEFFMRTKDGIVVFDANGMRYIS